MYVCTRLLHFTILSYTCGYSLNNNLRMDFRPSTQLLLFDKLINNSSDGFIQLVIDMFTYTYMFIYMCMCMTVEMNGYKLNV